MSDPHVTCPTCGTEAVACFYCDRPATILCDGIWAFPAHEDDISLRVNAGRRFINVVAAGSAGSCDRPLCDEHATATGHMCGSDGCDTIDLCPDCLAREQSGERVPILTAAEMREVSALRTLNPRETHA